VSGRARRVLALLLGYLACLLGIRVVDAIEAQLAEAAA
jgi:hypothetical protein